MDQVQELQRTSLRRAASLTVIALLLILEVASCPSAGVKAAEVAAAGGHVDDVACLREFKQSVTDPLGYLRNWDFRGRAINICKFVGVTCVSPHEPKVVALNLAGAGLGGRITPRLLFKCSNLRELNLSNNFFTGRVPATICLQNRNLENLDVSNNNFRGGLSPSLQYCLESHKRHFDSHLGEKSGHDPIDLFSDAGREEQAQ